MFYNTEVSPHSKTFEKRDLQQVEFILQTYSQTGRIMLNPLVPQHLIESKSYPTEFDAQVPSINLGNDFRPVSPSSQLFWTHERRLFFKSIWLKNFENSPKTVLTIKALLFLQQYRPDISDVNFLTHLKFIQYLADAYDLEGDRHHALNHLKRLKSVNIDHIKLDIKTKLLNYIESRGTIEGTQFFPNRSSSIFRDAQVTEFRINLALRLINKIQALNHSSLIQEKIQETKQWSEEKYPCTFFKSHFSQCMDECLQLISQQDESFSSYQSPSPHAP